MEVVLQESQSVQDSDPLSSEIEGVLKEKVYVSDRADDGK